MKSNYFPFNWNKLKGGIDIEHCPKKSFLLELLASVQLLHVFQESECC